MRAALLCHLFLAAAVAVAQPPIPPAADHARPAAVRTGDSLTVADGKFADVTVDVPAGASVVWRFYPPPVQRADKLSPGRAIFAGERGKAYTVTAIVVDFKKQTVTDTEFSVLFAGKAEPKPDDPVPPPKPKPDDPKPGPVTSFHVVMVYESGATLTAAQTGVLYAADIRAYLDANATPDAGTKGWRLRDKDVSADNDTAFQKSLWAAVRPQVTALPCWAVEVNGKVDIVPLPATVADGLALLRKYKGGE